MELAFPALAGRAGALRRARYAGDRGAGAAPRLPAHPALRPGGAGGLRVDPAVQPSHGIWPRSEEHTSELQSQFHLVCRLLLEKKKKKKKTTKKKTKVINRTKVEVVYPT